MTQFLHLPAPIPGPPTPGLRASAPWENWSLQLNSHRKHFFFFFSFFSKKGKASDLGSCGWRCSKQIGPKGPSPAHQPGRRVSLRENTAAPFSWPHCSFLLASLLPEWPGATRGRQTSGGSPRRCSRGTAHGEHRAAPRQDKYGSRREESDSFKDSGSTVGSDIPFKHLQCQALCQMPSTFTRVFQSKTPRIYLMDEGTETQRG